MKIRLALASIAAVLVAAVTATTRSRPGASTCARARRRR